MTKDDLKKAFGDSTDAVPYLPKVYLCDPKKNKNCKKTSCYKLNMNPEYGQCKYTTDPECSADGKTYIYDNGKYVEVKK